jgi:hypothetical protein
MATIALVREEDASDDRVKEAYRDIKESLRVSFVDALFLAYAANARFLDHTWRRLRPSALALPFVEQARKLGDIADEAVAQWPISDHAAQLHLRNYGDNDLRKLREIVELFRVLDPKLLIIAYAVKAALSGEPIGGVGAPHDLLGQDRDRLVRDFRGVRLTLADEREAPLRVRTVFEEIARTTGVPLTFSLYRAIGAYPDWIELFWSDCKATLADVRRRSLRAQLSQAAYEAARQLPYPLSMPPDAYLEMTTVNDLFCDQLPALIINAAVAKRGLGADGSP